MATTRTTKRAKTKALALTRSRFLDEAEDSLADVGVNAGMHYEIRAKLVLIEPREVLGE